MKKILSILFFAAILLFPVQSQALHLFNHTFQITMDNSPTHCVQDGNGIRKLFWIWFLDLGDGFLTAAISPNSSFEETWGMFGSGKQVGNFYLFSAWTLFEEGGWMSLNGKIRMNRVGEPMGITGSYMIDGNFEHPAGCFGSGKFRSTQRTLIPYPIPE